MTSEKSREGPRTQLFGRRQRIEPRKGKRNGQRGQRPAGWLTAKSCGPSAAVIARPQQTNLPPVQFEPGADKAAVKSVALADSLNLSPCVDSVFIAEWPPVGDGPAAPRHRVTFPSLHCSQRAGPVSNRPVDFLKFLALVVGQPQAEIGNAIHFRNSNGKITRQVAFHVCGHILVFFNPPGKNPNVGKIRILRAQVDPP